MNYIISEKEVKRLEADLNKQLNINLYDSSALLKLTKYYCIHNDYRKASNFLLLCDQLGLDDDYFNYYRLLTFYKTDPLNLCYGFDVFLSYYDLLGKSLNPMKETILLNDMFNTISEAYTNQHITAEQLHMILQNFNVFSSHNHLDITEYTSFLENIIDINQETQETFSDDYLETIVQENKQLKSQIIELQKQIEYLLKSKQTMQNTEHILSVEDVRFLIIGAPQVKLKDIKGIIKSHGFNIDNVDFLLDYDKMKHFDVRELQYSSKYHAILIGEIPHSIKGMGGASSLVQTLSQEGYPKTFALRGKNGNLRMTKTSLKESLNNLKDYISLHA
jgi:uncharacterized phage infection (PIP) family protein YhgE